MRGSGEQERMLQNARTEYQEEAWEIATYTIIDAVAVAAGDKPTAKLARDILRQEERMQQFLGTLLPELSADVAHDEIPVAEIDGPGSRRRAADSKPKSSSSRATNASTRKKTATGGGRAKSAGKAKKT
jgi:rubrerythrin